MRTTSERATHADATPSANHRYRVLPFSSRSDAVKYCLKVSDALESAELAGDPDGSATLWLAAAEGLPGAVNVYACDRALAAARRAGIEARVSGQVGAKDRPGARCLVIGDDRLLES